MSRKILVGALFCFYGCALSGPAVMNDVHSRLNATEVDKILSPKSTAEVIRIVREAKAKGKAVSISGGRHAMGGQQFGTGTMHIRMDQMNDVLAFDAEKGIVRAEAGIQWPKLMDDLQARQINSKKPWGIVQKQTGADKLSLGGSLSANIHGRGTKYKPMVQDVESFTLVNAEGELLNVTRTENPELFKLVIGGYGLFGVIATVDLRLQPRFKIRRKVEVLPIEKLPAKARERIRDGYVYGDFQYKTDETAGDYLKVGVFSTYKPVPDDTPIPENLKRLSAEKWNQLLFLAHTRKSEAFDGYSRYYLTTDGQVYWSDLHQMSYYNDEYLEVLKKRDPKLGQGSLMISEVYVPRERITDFIQEIRREVKTHGINIVYGTLRLIEKDDETFLPWAKQNYACIIFNLRVEHSEKGMEKAKEHFRVLINRALERGGSFYLTYHRWARKEQILTAYPQFIDFLKLKLKYDPEERFQSDWYRHYQQMFSDEIQPQVAKTG